jgi:hypothetical protein
LTCSNSPRPAPGFSTIWQALLPLRPPRAR